MKELTAKLAKIQRELNAPKNQYNSFGKYSYRNCEDILQALKPFMDGVFVTITDDIHVAGDRVYIKATATISDGTNTISATAFAREAQSKKGMDDSQLTGSTSSYARKYALNGLFLIDDNKDADSKAPDQSPAIDDTARQWIEVVKANPAAIDQIKDPKYKAFIQQQVNK